MKLFIPSLGSKLKLLKPWTFKLYDEDRNDALLQSLKDYNKTARERFEAKWEDWDTGKDYVIPGFPYTLPKGTVLLVDRIYIRKGQDEFNSVTFCIDKIASTGPQEFYSIQWDGKKIFKRKPRFWAKLEDVNQLNVEKVK